MDTLKSIPDMLTTAEAAELLGRRPQTLCDWRWQRVGPRYYKIGGSVRYAASDIREWIAGRAVDGAQKNAAANSGSGSKRGTRPAGRGTVS